MRYAWCLVWLFACGSSEPEKHASIPAPAPAPAVAPAPTPAPAPEAPPALENFRVKFETTKGDFVVEVHPDWAPRGAARFKELVAMGYYDKCKFFRAIDGFMVQFGINGDPKLNATWKENRIQDDPVRSSNIRGRITFATAGPNTRTTQLFINYGDNATLDGMGFAPFGEVVEGMDVVDSLYKGYGEGAPRGRGPDQGQLQAEGNAYLEAKFPKLDGIVKATLLQ
jgi:peptidyl-prolyl cis-trans isomerase A (cyclophilin A)